MVIESIKEQIDSLKELKKHDIIYAEDCVKTIMIEFNEYLKHHPSSVNLVILRKQVEEKLNYIPTNGIKIYNSFFEQIDKIIKEMQLSYTNELNLNKLFKELLSSLSTCWYQEQILNEDKYNQIVEECINIIKSKHIYILPEDEEQLFTIFRNLCSNEIIIYREKIDKTKYQNKQVIEELTDLCLLKKAVVTEVIKPPVNEKEIISYQQGEKIVFISPEDYKENTKKVV